MADKSSKSFDVSNLLEELNNVTLPCKTENLNDIVKRIRNGNCKIITFTGAGISTAAGIPDFRSEDGLYNLLKSKMKISNPELVFDLSYFKIDPKVFYCIAKEFLEKQYKPTLTHCFIKLLQNKGLLYRNFTQNVDGLDHKVGISDSINVECHGHFRTGHCLACNKEFSFEEMNQELANRDYIKCTGKKSCQGLVKPDIVLFGESLPRKVFENIDKIAQADLIIVMGSSLMVSPFNQFIGMAAKDTPILTINNEEPVGGVALERSKQDCFLLSTCDEAVKSISELLGWQKELNEIYSTFN